MNFPRLLVTALVVALTAAASAQERAKALVANELKAAPIVAPDAAAPAQVAAQFFASLREGEIEQAYTALTKGSKIGDRPEELRLLKQKTKEAIEVFGVISGYELVENKAVGTRLIRSTYISLGKEFPLRWRFYFYKADSVWRLVDLRVDDKLTGIFEEAEEAQAPEAK
jgi:hypothetical protein